MSSIPWVRFAFVVFLTSSDSIAFILIPPFLSESGYDYSLIGVLVGVTGVASLGSRFPSGAIYRRHRAKAITAISVVVLGLVFLSYPFATSPILFGIVQFAMGGALGVATTTNMAMFMDTIPPGADKHRAMAVYAAALSFGHMIGNLIGGLSADRLGYTAAFQLAAVTAIASVGLLMLDRLPAGSESPESQTRQVRARTSWTERAAAPIRAMSSPKVVAVSLVAFLLNFLFGITSTFFPLYALSIGLSLGEIGLLKSVHSLTNTFARPFAAAPLRAFGALRSAYIGLIVLALTVTIIPSQSTMIVFVALMLLFGFLRAVVLVANTVGLADLDEKKISRGLASSLYNASKDVGILTSPALCGAIASVVGLSVMMTTVPIVSTALFFGLVAMLARRESTRSSAAQQLASTS